ncbi:MAG: alginate lyase family protein, partial [Woeseiaceae bacterium]
GRWIARFPSLYSSANNHLVAESAALYILGTVAPQLPESAGWRAIGIQRLAKECDRQIFPDGAGAEQSPTYLAYTLEWLLLTRVVGDAGNAEKMPAIDAALHRGALFISRIADVRGNIPFFGDCDDGVVLRPVLKDVNYLDSIVSSVAGVLQDAEVVHPAFSADLRAKLLAGGSVPDSALQLQSSVFQDGGYTVLRSGDGPRETYLLFDHGPLGFAHTAAHGHADALSVWLHIDGVPVFVDFGTYRYNADSGWRDWARHTAAHNTLEIDGESQSEITGPFNWGRRAQGSLLDVEIGTAVQHCRASHDGYQDLLGVTHERQVTLDQSGSITISDSLSGTGQHAVKSSFHVGPDATAELLPGNKVLIRLLDTLVLELTVDYPGLQCDIVSQGGNLEPGPGAVSRGYNDLVAAQSIIVSGNVEVPCRSSVTIRRLSA